MKASMSNRVDFFDMASTMTSDDFGDPLEVSEVIQDQVGVQRASWVRRRSWFFALLVFFLSSYYSVTSIRRSPSSAKNDRYLDQRPVKFSFANHHRLSIDLFLTEISRTFYLQAQRVVSSTLRRGLRDWILSVCKRLSKPRSLGKSFSTTWEL